jgi:hypothetical protein
MPLREVSPDCTVCNHKKVQVLVLAHFCDQMKCDICVKAVIVFSFSSDEKVFHYTLVSALYHIGSRLKVVGNRRPGAMITTART